mgnify:CR=1 FL=1
MKLLFENWRRFLKENNTNFISDLIDNLSDKLHNVNNIEVEDWMGNFITTLKMYQTISKRRSPEQAKEWLMRALIYKGRDHYDWLEEHVPEYSEEWKQLIENWQEYLKEAERPGPGRTKSRYEQAAEPIAFDGFAKATYDATGQSGGFLEEDESNQAFNDDAQKVDPEVVDIVEKFVGIPIRAMYLSESEIWVQLDIDHDPELMDEIRDHWENSSQYKKLQEMGYDVRLAAKDEAIDTPNTLLTKDLL